MSAAAQQAASDPAVLEITGDPRDALAPEALRRLDAATLGTWLRGRRWFGAKGSEPADVRIAGAVRLPWGRGVAIALLEVELPDGHVLRYQLPLVVRQQASDSDLAEVRAGAARGRLADASLDPAFRRALGEAFVTGFRAEEGGLTFVVEPVPGATMPGLGDGEVGSAEQSNTSIRYGRAAICKLFRRIEPGENPDVEISRAITAGGRFAGTPELLGTARLETGGQVMTSAMLQRLVAGAEDAWAFALDRGRAYFADHGAGAPPNTFTSEARKLGRLTGEMHAALADAGQTLRDFAPRPVDDAELERWTQSARRSVERGLALLEARREAGFPGVPASDVESVLLGGPAFLEYVQRSAARVRGHAGLSIRHHGDYHLGQVLHDEQGRFHVIDFEGEPARSIAERREPHSALRDVAGMLRSFVYAAATLQSETAAGADRHTVERHRIRAELWERAARDAFLEAYLGAAPPRILPDSAERVAALLALFETEKVFYELAYEVNNRPAWAWIPLRGILRLPCR